MAAGSIHFGRRAGVRVGWVDAKADGRASVDLGLLLGGPEEGVAADGDEGCGDHQHHAEVEGRRARRVLARAARRSRSHHR